MSKGDADYRDSEAATMLAAALKVAAAEERLSQRALAKRLGYKQAVVLSHMALGRVPIPVERAGQLAQHLHIDERAFTIAVLRQRYPDLPWGCLLRAEPSKGKLASEIEIIAGKSLDDLSIEQQSVMREVAGDPAPGRRWLSIHEIPAMMKARASSMNLDAGWGDDDIRPLF